MTSNTQKYRLTYYDGAASFARRFVGACVAHDGEVWEMVDYRQRDRTAILFYRGDSGRDRLEIAIDELDLSPPTFGWINSLARGGAQYVRPPFYDKWRQGLHVNRDIEGGGYSTAHRLYYPVFVTGAQMSAPSKLSFPVAICKEYALTATGRIMSGGGREVGDWEYNKDTGRCALYISPAADYAHFELNELNLEDFDVWLRPSP